MSEQRTIDPTRSAKSILFRLRRLKLAKACMGLQSLTREAADELEKLIAENEKLRERVDLYLERLLED